MIHDLSKDNYYLKEVFKCTDKKIKIFKSYLKNKLQINSYTLGEFSLKHDEKFQKIFLSSVLKKHVISKKKKDKLFIINEIILDKDFFQDDFYFQYFLKNVLLLEDLLLRKLENNLSDDLFFKEKEDNSVSNWKQCYIHIKKKLNEKGIDEKSKIYNNSILLFNSTKFSYEDKNCCDFFYGLKQWDTFFNYVSFDFLNYLLSNTLIFISDFFFNNSNKNISVQNSFFIIVSHIELKYENSKEIEDRLFSRKRKLFYDTKQLKILYQKENIKNKKEQSSIKKSIIKKEISKKNRYVNAEKEMNEDEKNKKINSIIKEDIINNKEDEKINTNFRNKLSEDENKKHNCNMKDTVIKREEDIKTNVGTCKNFLNKRNTKINIKEENVIHNCKKEKFNLNSIKKKKKKKKKRKSIMENKYKYLLKKKREEFIINDSHSYVKLLYLLQCSGRILKNEVIKEIQEIQKEIYEIKRNGNKSNVAKEKKIKRKKEKFDKKEPEPKKKKIILPEIQFFYHNNKQNEEPYKNKGYNHSKCVYDKKKWNRIIINRNNILQHNTTNKYKNFLFNEHIIFDKLENVSLFTYHLLNYIFKSDQKYFFHNNFIDEYKQKISKQIKCYTKKNVIFSIISKKYNILLDATKKKISTNAIKEKNKQENISLRVKKTKILKYVYSYFEEFINNVRNTKFQKVYYKFFPKKYTRNKIVKIFKIIKLHIIKKYNIINVRKNRKFIRQKIYDFFFKNFDFLSFSFKTYKVINFIVYIIKKCIPVKLLGRKHNFKVFLNNIKKFLLFNFKESFSMDQVMKNIKVKNIFQKEINNDKCNNSCGYTKELKNINELQNIFKSLENKEELNVPKYKTVSKLINNHKNLSTFEKLKRQYFNKIKKINISIQKRHLLSRLIYFLFSYFIMPIIRKFFFLTKSEQTVNKTIYFDRKIWNYFTKISNFSLYHQIFRSKKLKKKEESKSYMKKKRKKVTINKRKKSNKVMKKGIITKKKIQKIKNKLSLHNIRSNGNIKRKSKIFNEIYNKSTKKIKNNDKALNIFSKQKSNKLYKSIDNLYKMEVLNKKNVRPYLKKFYYKIRKKYFSLRKKYIMFRRKSQLKPKSKRKFIDYINYYNEKRNLLCYISKHFFKNKKVNYMKRFIKLIKRIKKKVTKNGLENNGIKQEDYCSSVIQRIELKKKRNINSTSKKSNYFKNKRIMNKRECIYENNNKSDKKKIYICKMKNIIEKRNFLLKLNSIDKFFSKKLRINWVPKKKGLRPLINLSTLNIPESIKHKILEILKNKKSSEFYLHNILNNLEKEKKKGKKKYNRKNFNSISLNNICNFPLKCLGNLRHNKSSLFKNTITKTNEIEMKLKKWLHYIKNYFYRKKRNKKYIKNKLKNNKIIYAYICVGDFSNCYEHINHNYLFKILKNFFQDISNFEFIYLFKRSFRLFNKNLNNSLLSYYPVNIEKFGMNYINNLRDLIVKSNKNIMNNFLLKQLFKSKSMTDLYIFADSYKSVLVEKRDIFMTIITVIRYYYLHIYFSVKEIKFKKKNIFYFQIFKEETKKDIYLHLRHIKKLNKNELDEKNEYHNHNNETNHYCNNNILTVKKVEDITNNNLVNIYINKKVRSDNEMHIVEQLKKGTYKYKYDEISKLGKRNSIANIPSEKHYLNFLDKKIISNICGLPQGFSLSNILCSLYYAYLDKNEEFQKVLHSENQNKKYFLRKNVTSINYLNLNSLLIRFIDDFLFITLNKRNMKSFKNLLLTKKIWGSNINSSKTKIFKFPLIYKNDILLNNTMKKSKKNKQVNTFKIKKERKLKKKNSAEMRYNTANYIRSNISSNSLCKKNFNTSSIIEINNSNEAILNRREKENLNLHNDPCKNVKKKKRKKKKKKITSFEIDRVIKMLNKKKKKRNVLHAKKIKISKDIKRLKKLKKRITNLKISPVASFEWLNNSYTFDFINNAVHSTSNPWKSKSDATIRNHLHLNNIILDKNNKNSFMKNLVENRIVRNIISKQKKYKIMYKNNPNIYFCYKKNFILLKTSILKFICSIKTLKRMFNAFYNASYNTRFILYLISYIRKSLIKNKKLKFVKLFLIETAIESFKYAKIYVSNNSFYPCFRLLRKIRRRLINKCKTRHKRDLLRQYHNLFNFIKKELFHTWPYMFKIKEVGIQKKKKLSLR